MSRLHTTSINEKAYYEVDWDYLDAILKYKDFDNRWRWIGGCLRNANFSVMINGRLRGKNFAKRGLRQGDPISHFLFTIIGDALSRIIHFPCEKRVLRGL